MAATIYRFRWLGCELSTIKSNIDPTILATLTAAMPKAWVDVSLDPGPPGSEAEADLKSAMLLMGWVPFATSPTTPLRAVTMKQELLAEAAADASTGSTIFAPLLSQAITTDTGFLDIAATVAGFSTVPTFLRVLVDGVVVPNGGTTLAVGAASAAIRKRVPILPGAHVISLEWCVSVLGTSDVRPATAPDGEHASLYVAEVVS